MSDLRDLESRLAAAVGPDPNIDEAIKWTLSEWKNLGGFWREHKTTGVRERFNYHPAPAYTSSIDAALTLVPEGWECDLSFNPAMSFARVGNDGLRHEPSFPVHLKGGRLPLALCLACIRARLAASAKPTATNQDGTTSPTTQLSQEQGA